MVSIPVSGIPPASAGLRADMGGLDRVGLRGDDPRSRITEGSVVGERDIARRVRQHVVVGFKRRSLPWRASVIDMPAMMVS